MAIPGGGPIGTELCGQAFARLVSDVTQIEAGPRILPREDPEVSDLIAETLREEGVQILTGHKAIHAGRDDTGRWLQLDHDGQRRRITVDDIIVAVGRTPNLSGLGLEELGIPTDRTVQTNDLSCRPAFPTSWRRATWPDRSSSPMPHPTRPGSPASTRCSAPSGGSGSMTA